MNNFELFSFPSEEALASAAAKRWIEEIARRDRSHPYNVALAGGRVTRAFYSSIASQFKAQPCDLDRVHFFWSDERCVPPTDRESNFAIAYGCLFTQMPISPEQIHRICGELNADTAVCEAEADVLRTCRRRADGWPVFDLILLGMGEDGHVASLFPDDSTEAKSLSRCIYRAVQASKPPPNRITMSYGMLSAARELWVLASGRGKEAALAESLGSNGKTPLARVLKSRQGSIIFTDINVNAVKAVAAAPKD